MINHHRSPSLPKLPSLFETTTATTASTQPSLPRRGTCGHQSHRQQGRRWAQRYLSRESLRCAVRCLVAVQKWGYSNHRQIRILSWTTTCQCVDTSMSNSFAEHYWSTTFFCAFSSLKEWVKVGYMSGFVSKIKIRHEPKNRSIHNAT